MGMGLGRSGLTERLLEQIHPRSTSENQGNMEDTLGIRSHRRPPDFLEKLVVGPHQESGAQNIAIKTSRHLQIVHRYREMIDALETRTCPIPRK